MAGNTEKQEAFQKRMEEAENIREAADKLCFHAMRSTKKAMDEVEYALDNQEDLQLSVEELISLADKMAKLGSSMAHLRMNFGFGVAYGFGTGCYSGAFSDTEEGNG